MDSKQFVRSLRSNMTDAERCLWRHLRAHRLSAEKFRRQQSIGPYIADFVHFGARVIVEADGGRTTSLPPTGIVMHGLRHAAFACCGSGTMRS